MDEELKKGLRALAEPARPVAYPPKPYGFEQHQKRTAPPASSIVPSQLARVWTEEQCEDFKERVSIMEFDGGMTRAEAEQAAAAVVSASRK